MFLFEEVLGNEQTISNLKMAAENDKIFHSYIFYGQEGVGRLLMAKCFAKLLQCENKNACGKCYACQSFDSDNNPDIIYVRPTKTKNLGVDDVREQIKSQVEIKPYGCKHKIFIIDNADKMTTQAQNALLKILEEPPHFIIFILIGESYKNFLPTINSRCIAVKINPVGEEEVKKYLQARGIDKNLAQVCASYSQGNIGMALKFATDEKFMLIRKDVLEIIKKLRESNFAQALIFVSELEKYKDDFQIVLDTFYFWYMDLYTYQKTGGLSSIHNLDMENEIIMAAPSYNNLYEKIKAVEQVKKFLLYNANFKMTLNNFLLKVCGC